MVVITINKEKCTGCGDCISICPGAVFELDNNGKCEAVRPGDCQECCSCIEVCPEKAISIDVCG